MLHPNTSRWSKVLTSKDEDELKEVLGDDLMEKESKEKLVDEMSALSSDDEYVEIYTKLSKEELEKNTLISEAEKRGIEKGIKNGIERGKKEIIINLLNSGMDYETISKLTNLNVKEIQKYHRN